MRWNASGVAGCVVAVLLVASSCTTSGDGYTLESHADCGAAATVGGAREAAPTRSAAGVDLAEGDFAVTSVYDVADAVPGNGRRDYQEIYTAWQAKGDEYVALDVSASTPECELVATHVRHGDDPLTDLEGAVGLFTPSGFEHRADVASPDGPSQSHAYALRGADVAWLETTSTNLDWEDWRLMVDTGGESPELLARSEEYFGTDEAPAIIGWYTALSASSEQIAWNTSVPGTETPVLLVHDGSRIRQIDDVFFHTAGDDAIYYLREHRDGMTSIHRIADSGAEEAVLDVVPPDGRGVAKIAVDGDTLAFTLSSTDDDEEMSNLDGQIYVVDMRTREAVLIQAAGDGGGSSYLDTNGKVVAFGEGSGNGDPGQYLFFLDSRSLVQLGKAEGLSGVGLADDIVSWDVIGRGDKVGVRVARLRE